MHRGSVLRALILTTAVLAGGCASRKPPSAVELPAAREPSPPKTTHIDAAADPNTLHVGGARLQVELSSTQQAATEARLREWVRHAAGLVSEYLGGFPVPDMRITLDVRRGGTVGFGQHFDGRHIRVYVGHHVDVPTLRRDWVMLHEMLHAAFPDLPSQHRWMQEGLSTYLETVVRVRAGIMDEREMWDRWLRRMPYGLVQPGEGGLDETHTWGRTYWGGALFWLLADVHLLRQSEGVHGLHALMRALRAEGINARTRWTTAQVVRFADRVTQSRVVSELYRTHALAPGSVNLERLWRRLGVSRTARGEIRLRDDAPWAAVRRAMARRDAPERDRSPLDPMAGNASGSSAIAATLAH